MHTCIGEYMHSVVKNKCGMIVNLVSIDRIELLSPKFFIIISDLVPTQWSRNQLRIGGAKVY